jgi:FlaA1/EpsC-like NDP-sugar epimerase
MAFDNGFYQGTRVAVTGAAGTVGRALMDQLLEVGVEEARGLDNNEGELFLSAEARRAEPRYQSFVTDVRDADDLTRLLRGVDYVFHAAALKHVTMCERSPFSAVATNVNGVENVIRAAWTCGVKRVLFASSDKAVNPTNVMGSSKLLGERLFTAATAIDRLGGGCIFASTRFGNVAGSRGSVIPVFTQQIARGGPVTLTDERMTRFIMTLGQTIVMLLECLSRAKGGEIFITKMPALRIVDLAEVMIELLSPIFGHEPEQIEIAKIGAEPGEKLFEELTSHEEIRRTIEKDDFLIVLPPFAPFSCNTPTEVYISSEQTPMTKDAISQLLLSPDVLPEELRRRLLGNRVASRRGVRSQ